MSINLNVRDAVLYYTPIIEHVYRKIIRTSLNIQPCCILQKLEVMIFRHSERS